ncbi:MAG: SPOR domain-containing protein [Alphaproteobacteria bacterium]
MKSLYVIVACLIVALLFPPLRAGPLDDASSAYHRGDFAAALKVIRPLAEQGDPRAQANLGVLYENGQGVPQDDIEAAKWYRKAANQGDASAQFKLGGLYWQGKGVPRDGEQAFAWYLKAAEQGYADAQNTVGVMYWTGRGIAQNDATAMQWFQKAAAQGHAKARKNLGEMEEKARLTAGIPPVKAPVPPAKAPDPPAKASAPAKAPPEAAAKAVEKAPAPVPAPAKAPTEVAESAAAKVPAAVPAPLQAPAKSVAKAVEKTPAPSPTGDYRVQLGSVKSEAGAEKEAARLLRLHKELLGGLTVAQVRADVGERGVYYRLRAGPLKDAAAATALCHQLAARNQGCIVIAPAK